MARYDRAAFTGLHVAQEARGASSASANHDAWKASEALIRQRVYPLIHLCIAAGLPEPTPEYCFHPTRKWRADYAFIFTKPRVLVEVDGGVWAQGRHTRGAGFIEDQRKLNAAALLGFTVLRYTPDRLGECIGDLRILFAKEAA